MTAMAAAALGGGHNGQLEGRGHSGWHHVHPQVIPSSKMDRADGQRHRAARRPDPSATARWKETRISFTVKVDMGGNSRTISQRRHHQRRRDHIDHQGGGRRRFRRRRPDDAEAREVGARGGGQASDMACRYLAFDIETATDVPGDDFNWRPHRPLGISCAATLASDMDQPLLWYGKTLDGSPEKRMSREDAQGLVQYLSKMAADGFRIVTWNGLGFDFDILAEESGDAASCRECALGHVDMMFQVFCSLGYPVALEKAAQGMGLPGKPPGMSGSKAPSLWAQGRFKEVLEYVAQDVRMAMEIAQTWRAAPEIRVDHAQRHQEFPTPGGWLAYGAGIVEAPGTRYLLDVRSALAPGLHCLVAGRLIAPGKKRHLAFRFRSRSEAGRLVEDKKMRLSPFLPAFRYPKSMRAMTSCGIA